MRCAHSSKRATPSTATFPAATDPTAEGRTRSPDRWSAEHRSLHRRGRWQALSGGTRAARVLSLVPQLQTDLAAGNSVLVLAPEQSYVQQAASLLAAHVPTHVLSGDTADAERLRLWERAAEGDPFVLVGVVPGAAWLP